MEIKTINKLNNNKVNIPSSKSYTNRALIIASLTDERTILNNPLYSDDTKYMIESLEKLGINFIKNNSKWTCR